ncbi:MAG: hypothetical protein ACFFG0_52435 [Candidatus Thorarchaeota archaeon]
MKFVVCIDNSDYEASLELGKIYLVQEDEKATDDLIRVVDESGEGYLYQKEMFVSIKVPKKVEEVLLAV